MPHRLTDTTTTHTRAPQQVTGKLLDIVGTGGDGAHTINISTAATVLAAACGAKAAKLGNRSVSSKCGASAPTVDSSACGAVRCGAVLC